MTSIKIIMCKLCEFAPSCMQMQVQIQDRYPSSPSLSPSEWLSSNWSKIVDVTLVTSDPLSNLLYLSKQLLVLGKKEEVSRHSVTKMWIFLAQKFRKHVTEVRNTLPRVYPPSANKPIPDHPDKPWHYLGTKLHSSHSDSEVSIPIPNE